MKSRIKVLIIEIGIKNSHILRKKLIISHAEIIFASSFLDVVDTIYYEDIHIIILSDFRGQKSTLGYIKMFKKTNDNFKLLILSTQKKIHESTKSYLIQRGADSVIPQDNLDEIKNRILFHYSKLFIENNFEAAWTICTKKTIRFLKNNYHLKDDLIDAVVKNTGYSTSSIYHSVKKDTGISVGEWIQKLRVNGAIELIKSTEYPIKTIGSQVGYKSSQGFFKVFKKITGHTPIFFRKELV